MKSLARPSFFRMFDLLLSTTNPGGKLTRWTHDGVEFERDRHSYTGPKHGLTIEIVTLTRGGRRGWCLMVTKEYWWVGAESKAFKDFRWARAVSGQRNELMAWLRAQEVALERSLTTRRAPAGQDRFESTEKGRAASEENLGLQSKDRSH
jgi:hypothetical protein